MDKKSKLFKNIIGYHKEKILLERIIDILNDKEKYRELGCSIPHGLLIYGPPGIGKTTFSKELLDNVKNRSIYIIRKGKADGDFINYMDSIFKEAKDKQPSIILLDDIDKFAEDDNTRNAEEFVAVQSLIDDIINDDIFVIATANNIRVLPSSLLRAGRFDIKLEIENPSDKDSHLIIKHYLGNKKLSKDINMRNISYILEGSSCAELEKVCNQAGLYAGFKNKKTIGMEELLRASIESTYDTNIEALDDEDKYSLETAYHEAGHALIGTLLEPNSISFVSTIKNSTNTRGITKYHNNDNYGDDIKFMKNRIMTLLAGKAAIEIIYDKCDTGAYSDLERAYRIAARFVVNFCMLDFNSWMRGGLSDEMSEKVKQNKDESINKMVTDYYNKVKEMLIENKDKLEILAKEVYNKKILFQEEIESIVF